MMKDEARMANNDRISGTAARIRISDFGFVLHSSFVIRASSLPTEP